MVHGCSDCVGVGNMFFPGGDYGKAGVVRLVCGGGILCDKFNCVFVDGVKIVNCESCNIKNNKINILEQIVEKQKNLIEFMEYSNAEQERYRKLSDDFERMHREFVESLTGWK